MTEPACNERGVNDGGKTVKESPWRWARIAVIGCAALVLGLGLVACGDDDDDDSADTGTTGGGGGGGGDHRGRRRPRARSGRLDLGLWARESGEAGRDPRDQLRQADIGSGPRL